MQRYAILSDRRPSRPARKLLVRALTAALLLLPAIPLTIAPVAGVAQNLPTLGDTEREGLSPLMERKLGEQIMRDIRSDRDYVDDGPVSEYLNNFGLNLVSVHPEVRGEAGFDFQFFMVRDPMLNAFALPGGFIGVNSGLVLAAQSESELAGVLSHEIGHVAQRHIARMLGQQKQNSMIQLAAIVLGALAGISKAGGDAAMATMMGGTGVAIQRQLNFSRDAEREADRIGLQIMRDGGYDPSGMVTFFGRLQAASRNYSDVVPPYLMTHPLTTERIADIEARIRDQRYKQRVDNPEFQLVRARTQVLQNDSVQGLRDSAEKFQRQMKDNTKLQTAAAKYGLAYVYYRQNKLEQADAMLKEAQEAAIPLKTGIMFTSLDIDIKVARKQGAAALQLADAMRKQYPISRVAARQYADALIASRRNDEAIAYLRDQAQLYRSDAQIQNLLAKVYAVQGKQALQHLALAEAYALNGSLLAAIEQLGIARKAPDATFYDQSQIDAREREWKEKWKDESKDMKDRG
ncbi:M48 family metalloprotease [Herbaspirillum robiniae]|uniref:M48 family metallopeptidase n=1 Tax=Herbaspirillum robiniae TaxID=2014887 RepID=A0A246WSN2_9BURK|nr:M48 family metalloprotease [Herbaspirillum robiniae]NUU00445.1 M48 family metallopeptidase [Herbaspirillum robiniae]OWY29412.1 peptidase M48 [Herbaspirillum robiniae]